MVIIFQFLSFIAFTQNSICCLNIVDVKVVRSNTKSAIIGGNSNFTKESIVSNFGQPTSTNIEEVEAAGGRIETIYYGKNYFYFARENNISSGFRISTSAFYVVLKDSLEIKIGGEVEKLIEVICKKRHFKNVKVGNSRFGIPDIGYFKIPFSNNIGQDIIETDVNLTITYDPQSLKVIEISKSDRY